MKKHCIYILFYFLLVFTVSSCKVYKENMKATGGVNQAITNAILDFSNSSPIYKANNIFAVWIYEIDNERFAVSIGVNNVKVLTGDKTTVGSKGFAPSRYIEQEGKIFIWWDDDFPLTQDALNTFSRHNLLQDDDDGKIQIPDFIIDDSQKGVDYYFCKNNLLNYKKINTKIGFGYYDMPELECK